MMHHLQGKHRWLNSKMPLLFLILHEIAAVFQRLRHFPNYPNNTLGTRPSASFNLATAGKQEPKTRVCISSHWAT